MWELASVHLPLIKILKNPPIFAENKKMQILI
jgi:hypothetical protein